MNTMHLIKATAVLIFAAVDGSAYAQQTATFTNPVTCTTGACRSGHLATRTRSGVDCTAYGTFTVTIGFNGDSQTAEATCSGSAYCSGQSVVVVGGQPFAVFVDAEAEQNSGSTTLPPTNPTGGPITIPGETITYSECTKTAVGSY